MEAERDQYSPEFMLKYRTPDKNPRNYRTLIIKVLREGDKTAGFVAYYKLNSFTYKLLYLAVDKDFRGKRYGMRLAKYAIQDMFARGGKIIKLVTRVKNKKARSLYKKLGFKETLIEDGFVYYALRKKTSS